ncbi:hypothetical protein [uncultured Tenacibaculum sp.]|uniref:hypothetical protein n=1 Tax=uncultured Tenacibaculum sp. TaxID=174713 RepID=UPI0026382DF5|nr:hypothetical protein [uncultured Tenacibaculum sp.]
MKTLKTTLLISMLTLLTISCTDLNTEDLVPETKKQNTELVTGFNTNDDDDTSGGFVDTGGDDGDDGADGTKGN